jgi:hypothetical protein
MIGQTVALKHQLQQRLRLPCGRHRAGLETVENNFRRLQIFAPSPSSTKFKIGNHHFDDLPAQNQTGCHGCYLSGTMTGPIQSGIARSQERRRRLEKKHFVALCAVRNALGNAGGSVDS